MSGLMQNGTGSNDTLHSKVVALAGGVGGAKLAHGLQACLPADALTVVVNTADDFRLWGLHISPDLDTVMYTLAGLANREFGWGIEGDTWRSLGMLGHYHRDTWFRLGDMDLATHILRTQMLSEGKTLTEVTNDLASSLSIQSHILPMCDELVQTMIETPHGLLDFQEYFVRHRHSDVVTGVSFKGIERSQPGAQVENAIMNAETIIFCPSNPIVSIGPILGVPRLRELIQKSEAPKVAVSPIIGGAALKGPAADMLHSLGHESSPVGVAALYKGIIDGMVIDELDRELASRIVDMGIEVEVVDTIMKTEADRATLAESVLHFCKRLAARRLAK